MELSLVLVLLHGCWLGGLGELDGGTTRGDGGARDSGGPWADAGSTRDAGRGGNDAGSPQDAGGADDAGWSSDAGAKDAGTPYDAGVLTGQPIVVHADQAKAIAPTFFGGNYWSFIKAWGNSVAGSEDRIRLLKPGLIRAGGTNADTGDPEPFNESVIKEAVTYARAVGAEPIIQVPLLNDADGQRMTAQAAGALVASLNVNQKLGIRYFAIGNEPDLYVDQGRFGSYSASQLCTDFASWADAMRAADPSIRIVGPDLSWKFVAGNDWLTPFLSQCKGKLDVVAVHRYPFAPELATTANVLGDSVSFRATLAQLKSTLQSQGLGTLPLAITEYNVSYDGDPAKSHQTGSPGTLSAALWMADQVGVGMEEGLFSMVFWSISEGWTLGLLNPDATHTPRPSYFALKLWADHAGSTSLSVTGIPAGMTGYATRGSSETSVFVLNKTDTATAIRVSVAGLAQAPVEVGYVVPAYSFAAMVLPDSGPAAIYCYGQAEVSTGSEATKVR